MIGFPERIHCHIKFCFFVVVVKDNVSPTDYLKVKYFSSWMTVSMRLKEETRHKDNHPTLSLKGQGIFYVQYPIDRASHIQPVGSAG